MRAAWRRPGRARLPRGEGPWAWLSAGSVSLSLLLLALLLVLLASKGLGHFWPSDVAQLTLTDGRTLAGRAVRQTPLPDAEGEERLYRTDNRDLDGDIWSWVPVADIERLPPRPDGAGAPALGRLRRPPGGLAARHGATPRGAGGL